MWSRVNKDILSKPETIVGCFTVLSRDTLVISSMGKRILFNEDLVSKIARPSGYYSFLSKVSLLGPDGLASLVSS